MEGAAVLAVTLRQNGPERHTGHVGVEELPEAVAPPILAGCVIGMRQRAHEDHALFLSEILVGDSGRRRRAAGEHDHAVALDHAQRHLAGGIGVRLVVAEDILDLLAENAIALQRQRLQRLQHAAALVDVLDRELIGAQLVLALVGIGSGLRQDKAELYCRAFGKLWEVADRLLILGPGPFHEMQRRHSAECKGACSSGAPLEDGAPCDVP
jgi:hypothetical protein